MITQSEMKKVLHYNPQTGVFTWIVSRGFIKAGKKAGGVEAICFEGKRYSKKRLAWLFMTGVYHRGPIFSLNDNQADYRFNNLSLKNTKTINKNHVDIGLIKNNNNSYGVFVIDKGVTTDLGIHDSIDSAFIEVIRHVQYR